eukprot:9140413-Pyramimonas_sp.AAC.1
MASSRSRTAPRRLTTAVEAQKMAQQGLKRTPKSAPRGQKHRYPIGFVFFCAPALSDSPGPPRRP